MARISSYSSIYALGHKAISELLKGEVLVQEKVDGSQVAFMKDELGDLHMRSKGAMLHLDAPEKMFSLAAATVRELGPQLSPGYTYRGEYLAKPRHNSLAYARVPTKHIILFDIMCGPECYLLYEQVAQEAERIGLEVVPLLYSGVVEDVATFRTFLTRESVLGGQLIEGVVVKPLNYNLFGLDKKVLMGKFVSEAYKEVHASEWRTAHATSGDVVNKLVEEYTTPARWSKAVLHLRELGLIEDDPRDIGKLIHEVRADVERECANEIKDKLWGWARDKILRRVAGGLPQWYKEELLKRQFEAPDGQG